MYEVEVKVPAAHDELRSRLEAADATYRGRVRQADTYFDAPHRDFAETDEALRVRRVTDDDDANTARLTYKGPMIESASKTRTEIETGVESGDAGAEILEALGFTPVATVEKTRDTYRLDGTTVVLDDVTGLGEYVEVETETREDPDAVDAARETAFDVLRRLDLDPADQVRTSYLELLLE